MVAALGYKGLSFSTQVDWKARLVLLDDLQDKHSLVTRSEPDMEVAPKRFAPDFIR